MIGQSILLLHGFASSGQSSKGRFLREKFESLPQVKFQAIDFNPTPTDFEFMTITGMINRLRQYILLHELPRVSLMGSSMGALVALHYAHRFGHVDKLLLLAPALFYSDMITGPQLQQWQAQGTLAMAHYALGGELPLRYEFQIDGQQYTSPLDPPAPVQIIHGRRDSVVPIDDSRVYARTHPDMVQLMEVDSDHRLSDQLDFIWAQTYSFFLGVNDH